MERAPVRSTVIVEHREKKARDVFRNLDIIHLFVCVCDDFI